MKIWAAMFCLALAAPTGVLYLFEPDALEAANVDTGPPLLRFELDGSRSKFMGQARRGALAWFKGHDHLIAVRDFSGRAELTMDVLNPASLEMTVQAASLEETSDVFTPQQKGIINKELKEIVLEPDRYPEITFRSTDIKG